MPQNMGTKIKDKRMGLKMTLAELGKRVGVQASTVRKWETGYIKDVRSDKIQRVAKALGVTPAYLMGWEDGHDGKAGYVHENSIPYKLETSSAEACCGPLGKEEKEMLRIFKSLNVKGRMKLLATAMELEAEEAGI